MHGRVGSGGSHDVNQLPNTSDGETFDIDEISYPDSHDDRQSTRLNQIKAKFSERVLSKLNVRALVSIILWYSFSIGLSVYNKNMFSEEGMNFHFPILTTSFHQLAQILMATLALYFLNLPLQAFAKGRKLKYAAAFASSGDIGLGNTSFLLVTLSFYTMIKSSALGFVLLFSVIFGLESASWRLVLNISLMTFGVIMMLFGETNFNLGGFLLVISASCCSGLRWALIKLLLEKNSPETGKNSHTKAHPVQAILAMSPVMFLCLLVWGLIVEGPKQFFGAPMWSQHSIALDICILIFPAVLAFCMSWAEFELLNATGPLTLAVAGIFKEVATISTSILVFHDKLTFINGLGILVTIISIGMYHFFRLSE